VTPDCQGYLQALALQHFENALLYAGTCLLEGVNVSEGRGTAETIDYEKTKLHMSIWFKRTQPVKRLQKVKAPI